MAAVERVELTLKIDTFLLGLLKARAKNRGSRAATEAVDLLRRALMGDRHGEVGGGSFPKKAGQVYPCLHRPLPRRRKVGDG